MILPMRFLSGLVGFALAACGAAFAIWSIQEIRQGAPNAWVHAIVGIVIAFIGGRLVTHANRL